MQERIINHYPPVIKNIKEMQQIALAEDREFEKLRLLEASVQKNMFLSSADESGVSRFEKLLGITPKKAQTIEDRKLQIVAKMRQGKISLGQLQMMLEEYSPGIKLVKHMADCELEVVTGKDVANRDVIYKIIDEILPLDICFEVSRELLAGLYACMGIVTENYVDIGWEG